MKENFWDFCYICIESAALAVNNCLKRIYRVVHINQLEQQRFCTANLLLTVVPQWLFHCTQTHIHTHCTHTHTHTHAHTHACTHTHTLTWRANACTHMYTSTIAHMYIIIISNYGCINTQYMCIHMVHTYTYCIVQNFDGEKF